MRYSALCTCYIQAEKIIADRQKSKQHIEHALANLHVQLDGHNSGKKPLNDKRLKSVNARIEKYEVQLAELSRELSKDVSFKNVVIVALFIFACLSICVKRIYGCETRKNYNLNSLLFSLLM